MAADLQDFDAESIYFEQPLEEEAQRCIERSAEAYGSKKGESQLLRAYFLAPEHPVVLVALYRYYFYQHRLDDALRVAERVLTLYAAKLKLPSDWRELSPEHLGSVAMASITTLRFYLHALKGAGCIELRLGEYDTALARLERVAAVDESDRLGAGALLEVTRAALNEKQTQM
ncbi:MAG: hypothetical protein HQL48_07150 [Gammaproteobacteria bacterium]|nr:hypothetical protein [Gammaproteobacteria bacterium]